MDLLAELVLVGTLLLALVVVLLYASRQRTLSRRIGSFSCSLHVAGASEGAWTAGTAQYGSGRLYWWRTLSLSPRPARTWSRQDLVVTERVRLDERDEAGRQIVLVRCRHREETFDLSMSDPAFAGLVSWLESGPRRVGRLL